MCSRNITIIILLSVLAGECFSQDQTLDWFTYIGGPSSYTSKKDLAFGAENDLYITGRAENNELLFGSGIHQDFFSGEYDAFLIRFSNQGQFVWSTYFGGPEPDFFDSMCARNDGKIIISGNTLSDEGIVFGEAYQEERAGNEDLFLAAFNPDGTLDWSTYFGGPDPETRALITCDSEGSILLAGRTYSQNLATPGAHDETFDPSIGVNPFLAKFSDDGSLLWCTYFDANFLGAEESISADGNGNIYFAIDTDTDEGLATDGAYQTSGVGNSVVLAKFSPQGELLWSTYVTGEGDEIFSVVEADPEGNVYLSARSSSETGISTEGAFQMENIPPQVFPEGSSAMIMKFSPDGERLWGTYFGGLYSRDIANIESVEGGILFSFQNHFIEDQVFGDNPFQSEIMGSSDVFITKFSDQGEMIWSTAFGGNSFDYEGALAVNGNNFALLGRTSSSEFYQNENSWQEDLNGGVDLYLALFQDNILSATAAERNSPRLTVYPNPSVSGRLQVDWDLPGVEQVDLVIFDQVGREVETISKYTRGSALLLNRLQSGIYYLSFEHQGVVHSKKWIVSE